MRRRPTITPRMITVIITMVTIIITTPTDDAAHLHGYEVEMDIPAGVPTELTFTATMSGSYELESHVTDAVWLNLVVS